MNLPRFKSSNFGNENMSAGTVPEKLFPSVAYVIQIYKKKEYTIGHGHVKHEYNDANGLR